MNINNLENRIFNEIFTDSKISSKKNLPFDNGKKYGSFNRMFDYIFSIDNGNLILNIELELKKKEVEEGFCPYFQTDNVISFYSQFLGFDVSRLTPKQEIYLSKVVEDIGLNLEENSFGIKEILEKGTDSCLLGETKISLFENNTPLYLSFRSSNLNSDLYKVLILKEIGEGLLYNY